MNEWMIASALLAVALLAAGIVLLRQRKRMKAEYEAFQQETDRLRAENIGFRREIGAMERELDSERRYADDLERVIEEKNLELQRADERVESAENRRTDAEKEIYARRMQIDQLQQQLDQAHESQLAQERLYQDIIFDRDQTIARLQEKMNKRGKKKKNEVLDQQITLDDLFGHM